jgi:hypothetical protein
VIAHLALIGASFWPVPKVGREAGHAFSPCVQPSLDGKRTLSVADFRGKKVLLTNSPPGERAIAATCRSGTPKHRNM